MSVKAWIPNLVTLGNLACGGVAIILVLDSSQAGWIGVLMVLAMVFDFLDGFVARALKVASPLGKQLDSLADMVTFGLLPGLLVYQLLRIHVMAEMGASYFREGVGIPLGMRLLPFVGLVIPLFSALRLAKFNVDTRQGDRFLGLATPANAFFFLSVFLIGTLDRQAWPVEMRDEGAWLVEYVGWQVDLVGWLCHPWVLVGVTVLFSVLLVTELPLLAFKFKSWGWKANWPKYLMLGFSVVLLAIFQHRAGPFVILLYFLLSFIDAQRQKV